MAVEPGTGNWFRVVWSGTMDPSAEEIFAYSRCCSTLDTFGPDNVADELQHDVTNMLAESTTGTTPFSNLGQVWPTHVKWTQLKVSEIDHITGALVGEPSYRILTDAGRGASSQGLPYQCSLAVTSQAAPPDRKRRNRFYLPPMVSTATNGHGRLLPTLIDDILTQIALAALAHETGALGLRWFIKTSSGLTGGFAIDRYYTGDVVDTIRRRRNKLPEVRHVHTPT